MSPPKQSKIVLSEALSRQQLNRALLARQLLLARDTRSVHDAVAHVAGMQAQIPRPPFMGLWTRLQSFAADDLLKPVRERKIVRASAMRGTIHLMTTRDFVDFRPVLAPMLEAGAKTIVDKRLTGVDRKQLLLDGREFFTRNQLPFDAFRDYLAERFPKLDTRAMAYTVRMGVPLVMAPTDVAWGWPANAAFTFADSWLGTKVLKAKPSLEAMVLRYLAAFGPATPADFQTWSYLRGAGETFEKLRPKLVTFHDEKKRELFDLPDAPRPHADTPAPVRFLPEYDNVTLSHKDRTRIVATEHLPRIVLKNLRVVGTFIVDGFIAGTWAIARVKKNVTLELTPFAKLAKTAAAELEEEGVRLLAFLESDAGGRAVRIVR